MMENSEFVIEITDLTHRFPGGIKGVDKVSLSIRKGAFVIMAGPNGSGKTTLLRHLNGLVMPSEGDVRIKGIPVKGNLLRARRMVGMVFQDADSQIVGDTVGEDAAFGPRNLGLSQEEVDRRVEEALSAVGLLRLRDLPPHVLSGGEKRRLAVAGVLAMRPRMIVFDEPLSSLDYPSARQVLGQIVAFHSRGGTVLLITHELDRVLAHAGRLVLMEAGRVVRDGPPEEVLPHVESAGVRRPPRLLAVPSMTWLERS